MNIAVFHPFLDNIGGAEIVALTLARELKASLYTTNIDSEKIQKMGFSDLLPHIHSIGTIPSNPPFRQQRALRYFRKLDLGKRYDYYIIAGDWAVSGAVNNTPNMWYAHSPLNELWAFKTYVSKNVVPWWKRPLFELWVYYNRLLTNTYSTHVGTWVANSSNTQQRVLEIYHKKAMIIHPPTNTSLYHSKKPKNYWISVNRLVKTKRIELQMKAFSELLDENLIIVGSYEKNSKHFENYKAHLEKIRPKNVTILHWVSQEKLTQLYAECKGCISTAHDEDFGMSVIEAMASGKPVIAVNEGGFRETILHNKTGLLIEADPLALVKGIQKINISPERYQQSCKARGKDFDTRFFMEKIKNLLPHA